MSNGKDKASFCSAKSAESAVPAEWKVPKNLHSDPRIERLIKTAQRENVATKMITILGNYDRNSFGTFFGLTVREEPYNFKVNCEAPENALVLFFLTKNCETHNL